MTIYQFLYPFGHRIMGCYFFLLDTRHPVQDLFGFWLLLYSQVQLSERWQMETRLNFRRVISMHTCLSLSSSGCINGRRRRRRSRCVITRDLVTSQWRHQNRFGVSGFLKNSTGKNSWWCHVASVITWSLYMSCSYCLILCVFYVVAYFCSISCITYIIICHELLEYLHKV